MKFLELLFPPRCPLCGEVCEARSNRVHSKCYKKLHWIKEPRCKRCGKELTFGVPQQREYCNDCSKKEDKIRGCIDEGRAIWLYEGDMKWSITDYKYHGMKGYASFYGREAVKAYGAWILKKAPDVIVPVPLHHAKKRQRGFNQAEEIGKILSHSLGIPMRTDLLYRKRWTDPQKQLSGENRSHNLQSAFEVRNMDPSIRRVLLVDDIYTTGSTIEACAMELKKKGVQNVWFLALCIGPDDR